MDKETSLSVSHLNKLFQEIKQNAPPIGSSQHVNEMYEQKIYNLLPLFCKMFTNNNNIGSSTAQFDIFEKFGDPTSFAQMVSRLMVTEIRRRASNKTTEKASLSIVEFLEISPTVNTCADKKGWILLSTLNILVSFNSTHLVSVMTANSLASTLVKCLYLFFDLPPCCDTPSEQSSDYMSNTERRQLLQKVFSQLLTRLCSSPSALNDLTRKDDLSLLFSAITSWCPEHNSIWRQTASDVIITMAKHNNINVEYLHSKNCVSLFVENIQRIIELGNTNNKNIILMFQTFVNFLTEYANNAQNNMINILFDDFASSFGYQFFVDFAIRLEQLNEIELLSELLLLTQHFTKVGISPLKPRPLSVNQVFIIENFSIPKPTSKNAIRNLKAFNILMSLWCRSKTEYLQTLILDTILNIYKEERANYFILEGQNTLSSFAERLEDKSALVQAKYYTLLEYVVFELNYVPCKELITVGMILKNRHSNVSMNLCMKSLNKIMKHNIIFREVYREVGLLDIVCASFSGYVQHLDGSENDEHLILADLVELLINVLSGPNHNNCSIFYDCGASKHIFSLITQPCPNLQLKALRKRAFVIVQQLILSSCGEEIFSQMLTLLHKDKDSLGSVQEVFSLKLSVLKSLLIVLSENHRIRALFRKTGGFVSVISVIVHMENCLSEQPYQIDSRRVWNLLRCVFATITTAMRFEPANSKYFAQEICCPSFTDSLRLLGCFEESLFAWKHTPVAENNFNYDRLFQLSINSLPPKENLSKSEIACLLLRYLYEMAIDILDRSSISTEEGSSSTDMAKNNQQQQPIVVYPCIVISIIRLIQFLPSSKLCIYVLEKIRRLISLERNLQVLCDLGVTSELLQDSYVDIFNDENNPLNPQVRYIFERLASQHAQGKDLRAFLRLCNPLNCIPLDELKPKTRKLDRSIALSRVKSLISMSTPKDTGNHFKLDPPFIEFDMSQEGFSCIFIPSVAPISAAAPSSGPSNLLTGAIVGNSDVPVSVIGGIGTGERTFPSQSGLSFTTWIQICVCNASENDDHNIGILTLYRANPANQEYTCFQVYINPREKSLTISTQELPIFSNVSSKSCLDSDHNIRLPVPELFDQNWHHIVVILNRTLLKNSTINIYIDGKPKIAQKLHYLSSIVGGNFGIANTSPLYINAFVGTPPQYRRPSYLVWKQGPCYLIEEPLHQSFVSYINMLGPNYIGSFQAINYIPNHLQSQQQQQIAEDRLIFGLNSRATSIMTLSKMRRVYSKFDCKQIAKIIGLSTHENATPIYVLHNSAGHLCGPSRPLGGVLIGNIGARCFVPKQITLTFSDIGGAIPLLGLIANSKNMETLYASVKAAVFILRSNCELQLEMERINGYQTLSMLLKRKRKHLNSHILHLLFDLISNLNTRLLHHMSKSIYINLDANFGHPPNFRAFKELLIDSVDIWIESDLMKTMLEHLNETIYESTQVTPQNRDRVLNIVHLREMNLLTRLVNISKEHTIADEKTIHLILVLCYKLLNQTARQKDILYFGQFIAALVPVRNEKDDNDYLINLRNSLLKVILQLMTRNTAAVNCAMQEELVRLLGFDWFLIFLSNSLHSETVTIGFVNLMLILSNSSLYLKFRDGLHNGNWLKDADSFIVNRTGSQLLGFNIYTSDNAAENSTSIESIPSVINKDLLTLPGFQYLNWLLSYRIYQGKMYLIILQTMLGFYRNLTPLTLEQIDSFEEFTSDNLMKTLFASRNMKNFKQHEIYCKDLSVSLFSMLNCIFCSTDNNSRKNLEYPKVVLHFVRFLYNNNRDYRFFCQNNYEFLNSLCKILITNPVIDGSKLELTQHPEQDQVFAFILEIFVNIINTSQNSSLPGMNSAASALFSNQKPVTIFENILNSLSASKQAQTKMIALFVQCITNSQEFNQNPSAQLSNESNNIILNFSHAFANIVLMMSIVVDKLWQNCYVDDKKVILECLIKILRLNSSDATGKSSASSSFKSFKTLTFQLSEITLLYRSTNRCVLYLISRTIESISERIFIFEVLQLIYSNRQAIITSKCNNDPEFFICLTHCLLQLIDEENISLSVTKRHTTWYVADASKNVTTSNPVSMDEGALLIASVAKKIWDEIYLSKKQLLEETMKIQLTPISSPFGITPVVPDISQLRDVLYDSTLKFWFNFIDNENQRLTKKSNSLSFELPNSNIITEKLTNMNKFNNLVTKSAGGLVSKIVGGTSGVVGNAISTAVGTTRKEVFRTASDVSNYATPFWTVMSKHDALYWASIHISIMKQFVDYQMKQKHIFDCHLKKFIFNEWLNYEYEFLTREKAIWGPAYGSRRLDKWMLDMTEGPNRMRKKLIRNDQFYQNYPYRPEFDTPDCKTIKFKSPISHDSKEYFKRIFSEKYFLLDKDDDNQSFELDIAEITATASHLPASGSAAVASSEQVEVKPKTNSSSSSNARVLRTKSSSDYDENEPNLNDSFDSFDISEYVEVNSEIEKQGISAKKEDDQDNEMQTILRLLEEGERITHIFRVARVQGLDSFEGLLLFGKEHFYLVDGFTLLKSKEIRDIDSMHPCLYEPIIPSTTPQGSAVQKSLTRKLCSKFAFEDIKEVHKRRYLLQPIALELFSLDGRNSLMVFPRNLRNKVYSRFLSVAVHITDNANDSLMGQKRNANVETGGLLSNFIGETSVTQRWMRGEISNFQYLMNLNTLAGRSYNDLMQYPVFPWIVSDYTSSELDFNNHESFRDLSKPMGAQTPERLEQFKKRFSEFDADTNMKGTDDLIQGPYHYGTFYSSAMIVASYLVRIEPFTQHFLRLQGGHFDLADRMFHSVGDAWSSASKNNMADLKELIPEFFYLPEFLSNTNRFDFGAKQNGVRLDDVILPPWAKNDPKEFIRVHRAALECDYVSAHLHEWIDLIFGYKQNGLPAVEATNVFHHLFYEGNADIYNIDDPLKKNATIGFINNFGQIPKQLFKKPHPMKKVFSHTGPLMSSLSPILPSVGLNSMLNSSNSGKVFIHYLDHLRPTLQPIKELKGAVGQIIKQDKTLLAVEQNKVLIPPNFNRYVAWGFADHSLRIGPYESDRALYVWESELFPPNGEILCSAVPNSRMIITAGTNSVISIWRIKSKSLVLSLVQKLYGHTEAVTCLATSASYGIIVSGSRDKACILWDLNRLVFIRQLGGGPNPIHTSPIAAIAINDLTGDIATCCSTMLYLWTINGNLIASVNTLNVPSPTLAGSNYQNTSQVLCLAFSTYNEWDPCNVLLTGSSDGVVKLWSMQYVQEPIESECLYQSESESDDSSLSDEIKSSVALNPSRDEIVRRLSNVSIQNENQADLTEESVSPDEQGNEIDWDILSCEKSPENVLITHSKSFTIHPDAQSLTLKQGGEERSVNPPRNTDKAVNTLTVPTIRNSKSDTALVDSFVVLNEQQQQQRQKMSNVDAVLKNGHQWVAKLAFVSKLTMHTAFERKDNKEPAAITCLAISKDHRTIYVGDARGRIYSWSVNENKSLSDHWIKDDVVINCNDCSTKFSITERKHHCRNCGCVFCAKCSRFESPIVRLKIFKPVRVCKICFEQLQSSSQANKR